MVFKRLNPDLQSPLATSAGDWPTDEAWTFAHNAMSLAEGAILFYRGVYPLESPIFPWGKRMPLPWADKYADGQRVSDDVQAIAAAILRFPDRDSQAFGVSGLLPVWPTGEFNAVQGLAVEAMLAADESLEHLAQGRHLAAALSISTAYQNIVECTCHAQLLLGIASANGRKGADVTNADSRVLKREAFEWLNVHRSEYSSKAAAARALLKIVPMKDVKTMERWVGDWEAEQLANTTIYKH